MLTNLFSLFFEVLQNFRNSASILPVLDLISGVNVLANFSTTVIHTATQHHIYMLSDQELPVVLYRLVTSYTAMYYCTCSLPLHSLLPSSLYTM